MGRRIGTIKGVDISTMSELARCGAKYYDRGKEEDLLCILKRYGINTVRFRLWHEPYSETGEPYGAGGNDLHTVLEMASQVTEAGFGILLDFQYSDFWADPGKQIKPKAWKNLSGGQMEQAVWEYTGFVLEKFLERGLNLTMVQVGNELSNGLLWPEGKTPHYRQIAGYIDAGIRGVRSVCGDIPVMLHLDNGGNSRLYREWFDQFLAYGREEFQVIGLSYYPFWHGGLSGLAHNMREISQRYEKDVVVAEVSMGFTMEDYGTYEGLKPHERKGYATKPELVEKTDYPMTKEGQCQFLRDFFAVMDSVPQGRGKGFFYWEPAWIPIPGSGWATEAALAYTGEKGPGGNEWANQALFDYEGNALPAWDVIKRWRE